MEWWVENYLKMILQCETVLKGSLCHTVCLSVMEGFDEEPSAADLELAIDALASGKELDNNVITPEVIKPGKWAQLYEFLCIC